MRNASHSTFIGTIREHVVAWRKREGWSREAVVQHIVEVHMAMGLDALTDIKFDPATKDVFERTKVNADRVFRWLDDEGKDNNLLPTNFIHSIWAAMPPDVRMRCVDDCLRPVGLAVAARDGGSGDHFDTMAHLGSMIKEGSEASSALVRVAEDGSVESMEAARKELLDVAASTARALQGLEAEIATKRGA